VREQTVSRVVHRYGNLPSPAAGPAAEDAPAGSNRPDGGWE
jgi:hypothetical protein